MVQSLKQTFQNRKTKVAVLMAAMMVMAISSASASTGESSASWKKIITDNLATLALDVLAVLGIVLAGALGIFGLQFAVRKALKFFKSATN